MSPDYYRQANEAADDRAVRLDLAGSLRPRISRTARVLLRAFIAALSSIGIIEGKARRDLIDLLGLHFGRARR